MGGPSTYALASAHIAGVDIDLSIFPAPLRHILTTDLDHCVHLYNSARAGRATLPLMYITLLGKRIEQGIRSGIIDPYKVHPPH